MKDAQPEQWKKFCALYPSSPEQKFLERFADQLAKADPLAADRTMRTFGKRGVLKKRSLDRWCCCYRRSSFAREQIARGGRIDKGTGISSVE